MSRDIHLWLADVFVDSITNIPTVQVGESIQFELYFRENQHVNVFRTPQERHRRLYDIVEWANSATIKVDRSSNGVSFYREEVPSRAPIESYVHPVEFGSDIERLTDHWIAITGGEDTREAGSAATTLRVDGRVLARTDEYDTRDELQSALGAGVV